MHRFELNLEKGAHIHFIGIGGISMSGLALLMIDRGYNVTGSDRTASHITDNLEKAGARVFIGHAEENINGAELVVYTAAVHEDNAEIQAAKRRKIMMIDRAEFLGAVMKQYRHAVGISGTHGKTTTTGMLTYALLENNTDPTISIGGELDAIGGNFRIGGNEYFLTEACEYTNSFLKFYPTVAVITNIEEDHPDFFSGIEEIRESFRKFALLTGNDGYIIANGSDENVRLALSGISRVITYGKDSTNDFYAADTVYKNGYPSFTVMYKNEPLCSVELNVPGEHNILNAVAAVAVCKVLELDANKAAAGINKFFGTKRRFEKKGICCGAAVIDDYAHHPTEIKATLKAAGAVPHNRICCIFQPHTYSRTKALWNDFVNAFEGVDKLIFTDIYAARESFDGETTSQKLAEAVKQTGIDAVYIKDFKDIADYVKAYVSENDIVFTMGAGTVTEISDYLIPKKA